MFSQVAEATFAFHYHNQIQSNYVLQVTEAPGQALSLLAVLAAHLQGAPSLKVWPVQILTSSTSEQAVQSLPYTLPALLQKRSWHAAAGNVAHHLIQLVSGLMSDKQSSNICQTMAACVLALRDRLPNGAWEHMPRVLTGLSVC